MARWSGHTTRRSWLMQTCGLQGISIEPLGGQSVEAGASGCSVAAANDPDGAEPVVQAVPSVGTPA